MRSGWIACFFFLCLTCSEARHVKTKHLPTTVTGTVCCDTTATSSKHASTCTNFISGATVAVECKPDAATKQASFTQVAKTDRNGEFKLSLNKHIHNIHNLCHVHLLHSGDSHCAVDSKAVSSSFRLLKPTNQHTTTATEYTAGVFTFKPHPKTILSNKVADPTIPSGLPTNIPSALPPLPDFMPGLPPLPTLPALPALPALPSLSIPQITTSISSLSVPKIPTTTTTAFQTKKLLSEKPNFNTATDTTQPIKPQQIFPPIIPPVVPSPPGLVPPVLPSPPGILPPIPLQPPSPPPGLPSLPIPTPPVPGIPMLPPVPGIPMLPPVPGIPTLPPVIPLPSPPVSPPPSGILPPGIPTLPPVIPKLPPGLPLPPPSSSSTSDNKVKGSSSSSAP